MVLIAAGTGLRMSELFGLKWRDVDFQSSQLSVIQSIINQVVGPCKIEASQKPVPLDSCLAKALRSWRRRTRFRGTDDWVFASPHTRGSKPYRGQPLMRYRIQPTARRVGITKHIGWHTFATPTQHYCGPRASTSRLCRNCCGMPPAASRWTPTRRQSRLRSGRQRVRW